MRKMRKAQLKKIKNQLNRYLYSIYGPFKQHTQLTFSPRHLIDKHGNFVENRKLKNIEYITKRIMYINLLLAAGDDKYIRDSVDKVVNICEKGMYIVEGQSALSALI